MAGGAGTISVDFVITKAAEAKTAITGVGTEIGKLGTTSTTASTNVKKVETTLGTTAPKAKTLQTNTQQLNTTLGQTGTNATKAGTSLNTVGTNAQKASTNVGTLSQKQQQLNTTSAQTTTGQRNVALGMATAATSFVNLGTQITALGNTYDSLNDQQIAIQKSTTGLKVAQDKVTAAANAYNKARKSETATDTDVLVKKNALDNAMQKLADKQLVHNDLVEDTNRAWKQFALQIASTVLTSITGVLGVITSLNSAKGLKGAATGIDGVAKSSHGLKAALGPIILVIAALAAAFFAIKNNTFGFRDALSDLGVKIGTAVPALKPILEFLKQLGGFLGIAGDESASLKEKFLTSITALKDQAIALFNQIVAGVQAFISQVLQIFDLLAQGDLAGAFKLIVDGIMNAWNTLNANEMVKGFIDQLIAVVTNPSSWTQIGTDIINGILAAIVWTTDVLVPMLTQFVEAIVGFVTDPNNWQTLWDGLVKAWTEMQDWAKAIEDFITPFLDEIVKWFEDPDNWQDLWDGLVKAWTDMQDWAKEIEDWIKPFVDEIVKWAGDEKNWETLATDLMKAWGAAMKWTAETVAPIVTSFFTALKEKFVPTTEESDAMALNIVNGISTAIQTTAGAIGKILYETIFGKSGTSSPEATAVVTTGAQAATDLTLDEMIKRAEDSTGQIKIAKMQKAIMDYFASTFQTNVEGYQLLAKYIFDGMILEINKAVQARGAEINQVASMVISFLATGFQTLVANLQAIGMSIINYIITGLTQRYAQVKAEGNTIVNTILAGIEALIGGFIKKGNEVIDNIVKGITAHATNLKNAMVKPFEDAWAGVLSWWNGIKGTVEEIGKALSDPIGYFTSGGSSKTTAPKTPSKKQMLEDVGAVPFKLGEKVPQLPKVQQATLGGQDMAGLFADDAGGAGATTTGLQALITTLQEVITWFEALQITIQANFTVWQAYIEGLTAIITAFSQFFVAFAQTSIVPQFELMNLTLLANFEVWRIYFEQLTLLVVAFSLLIVNWVQVSFVPQMELMNLTLLANFEVWRLYFEQLTLLIVAFDGLLIKWISESFITQMQLMNETILANFEVWRLYFEQLTLLIVAFDDLIIKWVSESFVTQMQLMNDTILANFDVWTVYFESLTAIIVAFDDLIIKFIAETITKIWHDTQVKLLENLTKLYTKFRDDIIQYLDELNEAWKQHAEAVLEALTNAGEYLFQFAEGVVALRDGVIQSTEEMSEAWMEMAENVADSVQDMVSELEDLVGALEDVKKAADAATKALEAMARAAQKAKSAASGVGGSRHGGVILAGGTHHASGGFINKRQRSINGHQVSEFGKWEAIIPLSDPMNAQDKNSLVNAPAPVAANNNLGNMRVVNANPATTATGRAGRGTTVTGNISTTIIVDGKKLAAAVNPYIMEGQDAEL